MLILTRKPGQLLTIGPDLSLDPATPAHELFLDGPIVLLVAGVRGSVVKLGIRAHPRLTILREELLPGCDTVPAQLIGVTPLGWPVFPPIGPRE
ncbi:MAG: hypothetical protein A2151_07875 [Candidatus Muproteobacteria bacterium RBG_16_65_34]|uniref:Carbon storage regulator n=1 Tax=Candidatus Muproteobacteria bacterium RBG_16_65_34 TaxID=1817760 RepID=A0A1F6TQL4_9PROT|nr:MAG: hypothetical protein A2151_07875 [Candidatus Muproteobacteria bacterium RBG_16_65_34]